LPKYLPEQLPINAAANSLNAIVKDGLLKPLKDLGADLGVALNVGTKTVFYYPFGAGFWFSFSDDTDVVLSPVSGNNEGRVYWTSESGLPQMGVAATLTGGVAPYPTVSYNLGVPAPDSAISSVVTGTASAVENENVEFIYTYTYVTEAGEESAPAPVSALYTVGPDQTSTLTVPDTGVPGNYNIVQKRIYRSDGGNDYKLLDTIAVAVTAYTDTLDPYLVSGDAVASWDWDTPPTDLRGLTLLVNGILAGYTGNFVYLSEPYRPHAFPSQNIQRFDYDVVGLAAFSQGTLVFTSAKNYLLYGYEPLSMQTVPIDHDQVCVSKRSIVDAGEYAVYAGPDGLSVISNQGGQIISAGVLSTDQWQELDPSSIHGYFWQGWYIGFYDNGTKQGSFLFNVQTRDHIIWTDRYCDAAFKVPGESTITCTVNDSLRKWIDGSELPLTYETKIFEFKHVAVFTVLRVLAESYSNISIEIWMDDVLNTTVTVTSEAVVKFPMRRCTSLQLKIAATDTIRQIAMAGNVWELGA
jgi:hypothetical protein